MQGLCIDRLQAIHRSHPPGPGLDIPMDQEAMIDAAVFELEGQQGERIGTGQDWWIQVWLGRLPKTQFAIRQHQLLDPCRPDLQQSVSSRYQRDGNQRSQQGQTDRSAPEQADFRTWQHWKNIARW